MTAAIAELADRKLIAALQALAAQIHLVRRNEATITNATSAMLDMLRRKVPGQIDAHRLADQSLQTAVAHVRLAIEGSLGTFPGNVEIGDRLSMGIERDAIIADDINALIAELKKL